MGSLGSIAAWSALGVLAYMCGWFVVAMVAKRNDIVDSAWGLGFVGLSLSAAASTEFSPRPVLVAALVTVWGLRLAAHIYARNRGAGEDFRYAAWREQWGRWFVPRTFLQVFMTQGVFMVLIWTPGIVIAAGDGAALGWLDLLGAGVALGGIAIESMADAQLRRFKSDAANKGRLMRTGLWGWSRHPNYFGETLVWWGIAILALGEPQGSIGLLGPVTITFLLLKVSGVPMLEKKYDGRPDFEEYKASTSAFVPLPPRKGRP